MSTSPQSEHEGDGVEQSAPTPDENAPANTSAGEEIMPTDDDPDGNMAYDFEVKEQDRWLPIANVARIMKSALPENAKIAKEAKECMQECVSEFISFITSEASEKCQQEKRKTVNGEDILFAMTSLGFENYGEALKIYLARYRENMSVRGENQKTGAVGGAGTVGNATGPEYDTNNHNPLSNPLDSAADSATDFAYTNTAGYD